jgi:hypothetical protein
MVLIFFGPFALNSFPPPPPPPPFSSFNHGLYTLAPIKYNTKTYVITANSIIKIYAIKDGSIDIYVLVACVIRACHIISLMAYLTH